MAGKKQTNDRVGRDQNITAGNGGVVIGGNVSGSAIVTGNNNQISAQVSFFRPIFQMVDSKQDLSPQDKEDLKAEIQELETEVGKGEQADETFLSRRLRNIQRMSPDILEVITTTLTNPIAGFSLIAKKVAEKAKASAT
jgi:hypothetical protein